MKKLARLTALLLTGALLLMLTACGAAPLTPEQQAKQWLLKEINSYRASIHLDPLVEVKQLSDAEQELIDHFRTVGKTELPSSEMVEAHDNWSNMTQGWKYCYDFGLGWDKGETVEILTAKVPANTPEGKAELLTALKGSSVFNDKDYTSIGIAVVTIDGQMYWTCAVYY